MRGLAIITSHGWLAVQVIFPNAPFLGFHIFHKYQCLKIGWDDPSNHSCLKMHSCKALPVQCLLPKETQTKTPWTWFSSWWFEPIWKILIKLDHFPKQVKIKINKTTNQLFIVLQPRSLPLRTEEDGPARQISFKSKALQVEISPGILNPDVVIFK